ncbi:MAG: ATP-binding protein [Desulfobacterales bacterium]|jgi:MinD superfamily P-loop ATPase|nr:ATP-binding protein [Desulfobacterales bacterium]
MIISIASGKGGTGKTTVAVSMALALDAPVRILDCDVEEPNVHLFLHPEILEETTVAVPIPEIDDKACTRCGKCAEICRFNAIAVMGKVILTFPELCHGCGGCMEICPENAVSEGARPVGVIQSGHSNGIEFVHGKLRIGEAMSPPLIRAVRERVRLDMPNIIDAPPGTSCPVIAAVKGTDFVLMVTEPTPFGLHDLKLAVEAVKLLGLRHGLVINRSDMGDSQVHTYAKEENIPILMEIPFDRRIAVAYSKGLPIVEALPEWKDKFSALFKQIESIIQGKGGV